MKIPTVLTAALAAAVMTFAAHSAERPDQPSGTTKAQTASMVPNKPAKPGYVTGEDCPYLFGCGDAKKDIDTTKTASIGKKATSAGKEAPPAGQYGDIIAKYAAAYGVPASLAHAVMLRNRTAYGHPISIA